MSGMALFFEKVFWFVTGGLVAYFIRRDDD